MHATPRLRAVLALALIAVLGTAGTADAKLDAKAWKAAKAEYDSLFQERGRADAKIALLQKIAGDGTARAWKLLAQALATQVASVEAIHAEYARAAGVHGDILLGSLKGYSPDQEARAKELQRQLETLEEQDAAAERVLEALVRILAAAPAGARKPVFKLVKPKASWPVRATAARVAAASLGDKASVAVLKKLLAQDPDPRVRTAALEMLAAQQALHERAQPLVSERLADANARVVCDAAAVVAQHPFAAAREPLRAAWAGASVRTRVVLRAAVEAVLADTSLASTNAALADWWKQQAKQPGKSVVATIPLETDSVLFVLDLSTYMKPVLKEGPWQPAPAEAAGSPPPLVLGGPRLDVAKHELKVAIRSLPESARFNILAYNHGATLWERSMQAATAKNKDLAYRWMRTLKASGSSYVEGALRLAFRTAGALALGPEVEGERVDTLVLLSFGKPTDNAFPTHRPVEPETVLAHVAHWNRRARIVIHAVCFGESAFLDALAARHGGRYVHR